MLSISERPEGEVMIPDLGGRIDSGAADERLDHERALGDAIVLRLEGVLRLPTEDSALFEAVARCACAGCVGGGVAERVFGQLLTPH